jgi:hypothetical protein
MYLPAVDYAAFRGETSQFHDSEPEVKKKKKREREREREKRKKNFPRGVCPPCCLYLWSNRTSLVESPPIPGSPYPWTNPDHDAHHPPGEIFPKS